MKIENVRIETIKNHLRQNKITYPQLSARCGIPTGTLRNIFSGVIKNPRLDTIQKIESALYIEETPLSSEYLTEQEEDFLRSFRNLSKENKTLVLTLCQKVELSERR
ncbi:MAG: helix-turn-helix transcriptional regulator [Clostridia bacterium]|nr:helix-turn-helix transcriptional regulator [Clostridia bacterium]